MDLITLHIFLGLILVFFFLAIPPSVRRNYNKYNEFEKIKDISKKYNIMKPGYLMFNLDHHDEGSRFYKWISGRSEKIPRNTDDPILFIKESIASIENNEEKKIYARWLINQLSERGGKNSDRKDHYAKLENTVHKIYDNIDHSDVSTEEKIYDIIKSVAEKSDRNNFSKYDINTRVKYLKTFYENPKLTRSELIELICEEDEIGEKDRKKFQDKDKPPTVLLSWEINLREALMEEGLENIAQKLKR